MREYKSTSLADQVFDRLENDIIQGVYAKGEILTELKLVERMGVSRTPIREALRRLEQDFLDDITLEQASEALGLPIYPTEADGFMLCDAIFGILPELPEPVRSQSGEKYYQYNQNT